MCLTLHLKVLSDNKVLKKLLIGYANICSSVQDHRQKILDHLCWNKMCLTINLKEF